MSQSGSDNRVEFSSNATCLPIRNPSPARVIHMLSTCPYTHTIITRTRREHPTHTPKSPHLYCCVLAISIPLPRRVGIPITRDRWRGVEPLFVRTHADEAGRRDTRHTHVWIPLSARIALQRDTRPIANPSPNPIPGPRRSGPIVWRDPRPRRRARRDVLWQNRVRPRASTVRGTISVRAARTFVLHARRR